MPHDPFYNSAMWKQAREKHLRSHPFCETCLALGYRTKGQQVDHRKSIRSGGHPTAGTNLCTLCTKHHSQKTIMIDGQHSGSGKALVVTGPDGFPVSVTRPNLNPYAKTKRKD